MTNSLRGVIRRSGLFVICHFESGASLEALEFRALSGSGPKYVCNEIAVALARPPSSLFGLRHIVRAGLGDFEIVGLEQCVHGFLQVDRGLLVGDQCIELDSLSYGKIP